MPLQLLDFAYRYTSGILSDSLRLAAEGYAHTDTTRGGRARGGGGGAEDGSITVTALRQAIASRTGYAFTPALSKEFMLEQAQARNKVQLPKVERSYGVQLPPEKYCLTGVGWGLKDEWESEEDEEEGAEEVQTATQRHREDVDESMGGMDGAADEDEEGAGGLEDVFGDEDEGGDTSMKDD